MADVKIGILITDETDEVTIPLIVTGVKMTAAQALRAFGRTPDSGGVTRITAEDFVAVFAEIAGKTSL